MRLSIRTLLVALSFVLSLMAQATIYYVSPTGNDNNNGTSQSTPWRTIDRVNQSTYQIVPGDQVLFKRGGEYRGEIIWGVSGTAGSPVTYGAYGTGNDPIISGAKLVTNWTIHSGNIYKAYVGMQVDYVYIGGSRATLARTPNTGWYRNSNGQNNTMTSANITQSSGYFTGARCILRSTASSVDTLRITNHSGSTLTFGNNPTNNNMGQDDWGFFVENKLNLLDAAGEWFYDKSNGYLYLWAPGSANPNSLTVEASVYESGVNCYWQRHYCTIQNLYFRYQRYAGVLNASADHVTVTGCTMEDVYYGIRSYGSYDNYNNNIIRRTYASGCLMIDNNSVFENNTLSDIAMILGMGENSWGYFGIRGIGQSNTIRNNSFTNVGYIAIVADGNQLIEKNRVSNCSVALNDGGAIAFDNANGMIIQDNILGDAIGGLDGSSTVLPHYQHLGVGIYFGNTNITNTTVQRNTVYNVPGIGINVDHCMNTTNLKIKFNTIFNCGIGMSVSDYSTTNGPFAQPPYYVANYNDEYTGNKILCLTQDQYCMRFFNCHSASPVDFGTFTNNRYFSPYDEMTILLHNTFAGGQKWYSLEMWQTLKNEESGTTRSPMRLAPYATTSELTGNLVPSGDFTSTNITPWASSAWPNNAQITRVTSNLDNGCLKAYIPNNSVYNTLSFRNPEWFQVTNGAWYRVRASVQSNANGGVNIGAKAQSTMNNPYAISERLIPFSSERRDMEFYFQSNITDNAQMRFINDWTEPMYYLDNVDVRKVNVQALDPNDRHKLFVNPLATAQSFSVPSGTWSDLDGTVYSGATSFTLQPYTSRILYLTDPGQTGNTGTLGATVFLGGPINWGTNLMSDALRSGGLIPTTEPYTAMGYALENAGATVNASVLSTTGNNAPVDWVVVELKNATGGYPTVARRACLVRRNGTVITPDGNTVITFTTTTTVGKHLVISHRNHLAVMSGAPIATNGQVIDFSTVAATTLYGTNAMQVNGSRRALWPGRVNSDVMVKYTGGGNDRDPLLTLIGSGTPNASVPGYRREDLNMDGAVRYTGSGNDRDLVLGTVGSTAPGATRTQQVP